MKSLDEIISNRRSVRSYKSDPVEKEKILQILEAARLAPSACNAQPWKFIVAHTPEIKNAVFKEGLNNLVIPNKWAGEAPVIIAVCSQKKFLVHTVAEKIQDVDYHLIDLGIACEHLVLKAEELGLGTCFIGWFKGKEIQKVLSLPSSMKIECLIVLGYPKDESENGDRAPRKTLEEISEFK
ncbi:MAG: nitroreductase family protein [Endomicrobia bacterium]|nr:nitroreductase family protein [Endomicrobiia bacterium]